MRITFLFSPGRLARMQAPDDTYPSEFFFGALELRLRGHTVDMLEVQESAAPGIGERLAQQFFPKRWLPPKAPVGLLAAVHRILPAARGSDVLVATNSGIAFGMAFWTAVLRFPVPLVAIHASILNYQLSWQLRTWGRFGLRRMHTQLFGPGELPGMRETFGAPADRIEVNLFGVDTRFWQPAPAAAQCSLLMRRTSSWRRFWVTCGASSACWFGHPPADNASTSWGHSMPSRMS